MNTETKENALWALFISFIIFLFAIMCWSQVRGTRGPDLVLWDANGQAYALRGKVVRKLDMPPELLPQCLPDIGAAP